MKQHHSLFSLFRQAQLVAATPLSHGAESLADSNNDGTRTLNESIMSLPHHVPSGDMDKFLVVRLLFYYLHCCVNGLPYPVADAEPSLGAALIHSNLLLPTLPQNMLPDLFRYLFSSPSYSLEDTISSDRCPFTMHPPESGGLTADEAVAGAELQRREGSSSALAAEDSIPEGGSRHTFSSILWNHPSVASKLLVFSPRLVFLCLKGLLASEFATSALCGKDRWGEGPSAGEAGEATGVTTANILHAVTHSLLFAVAEFDSAVTRYDALLQLSADRAAGSARGGAEKLDEGSCVDGQGGVDTRNGGATIAVALQPQQYLRLSELRRDLLRTASKGFGCVMSLVVVSAVEKGVYLHDALEKELISFLFNQPFNPSPLWEQLPFRKQKVLSMLHSKLESSHLVGAEGFMTDDERRSSAFEYVKRAALDAMRVEGGDSEGPGGRRERPSALDNGPSNPITRSKFRLWLSMAKADGHLSVAVMLHELFREYDKALEGLLGCAETRDSAFQFIASRLATVGSMGGDSVVGGVSPAATPQQNNGDNKALATIDKLFSCGSCFGINAPRLFKAVVERLPTLLRLDPSKVMALLSQMSSCPAVWSAGVPAGPEMQAGRDGAAAAESIQMLITPHAALASLEPFPKLQRQLLQTLMFSRRSFRTDEDHHFFVEMYTLRSVRPRRNSSSSAFVLHAITKRAFSFSQNGVCQSAPNTPRISMLSAGHCGWQHHKPCHLCLLLLARRLYFSSALTRCYFHPFSAKRSIYRSPLPFPCGSHALNPYPAAAGALFRHVRDVSQLTNSPFHTCRRREGPSDGMVTSMLERR